jgi:dTDP-4-amino-4,6-dideoxygalactose transaminase
MKVPFVDLAAQYKSIKPDIDVAIKAVLESHTFIGGEPVDLLEKNLSGLSDTDYCVSCANGTDALEIALEALGIAAGDEVLVPALTWMSTASSVYRVGAKPIFVDIDADFYTIDPTDAKSKITTRTKAIIPVHFYGLPADIPAIIKIAAEHNLFVIEDCAQAHGASVSRKLIGSFGHLATFSFYPGKNLGAYGDAGAIVTSNEDLAMKCRTIARLGQQGKHNHVSIGRNSRLDTIQAAILNAKIPLLNEWTAKRRRAARLYNNHFADSPVKTPRIPTNFKHVYHTYVIQVEKRDALQQYLSENGVISQIHYPKALTDLKVFPEAGNCPTASLVTSRIISLPMFPEISDEQINYVAKLVQKFVARP